MTDAVSVIALYLGGPSEPPRLVAVRRQMCAASWRVIGFVESA